MTISATPLRVLLVEDSEDDAALVILALQQGGYEVTSQRVETPEATAETLRAQTWDVIISDSHLPHFSAPAALALRRELGVDTPFIIVSGTVGEEDAVETMKAGALDFVTKSKFARLVYLPLSEDAVAVPAASPRTTAAGGSEAILLLEDEPASGREAAARVREVHPQAPVLYMTLPNSA